MGRGPWLIVSSDRLEKLEIEPPTPGLQEEWFIHNTAADPNSMIRIKLFDTLMVFLKEDTVTIDMRHKVSNFHLIFKMQIGLRMKQNKILTHENLML